MIYSMDSSHRRPRALTFFPSEVVDDLLRMGVCQLLRPLPSHDLQRQVRVGDVCFDGDEQSPIVSARVTRVWSEASRGDCGVVASSTDRVRDFVSGNFLTL